MKRLGLCVIAGALLAEAAGLAQTAPKPPSVSVRRLSAITGRMVPGDFNRDGIVDLASGSVSKVPGPQPPVVVLGRGDGTFNAPIATVANGSGTPLTTGDFNKDGRLDLIADLDIGASPIFFLPGNGNGTFGTPVQVGGATEPAIKFALADDFNGDGNLDVGVGMIGDTDEGLVLVYAGRGDGTFSDISARLSSGVDSVPNGGVAADLNGDGRRDVAVANRFAQSVSIFINQGAFNFTSVERPLAHPPNDVAAADVTGDGKLDLLVAQAFDNNQTQADGTVSLLPGNGNGTFGAAKDFATGFDPYRIVVADFNRDGVLDIATSNHSARTSVGCPGQFVSYWDSLTVLNGAGGGNFVRAADFSIGNQQDLDGFRHRDTGRTLNVADLNGDGRVDFVLHDGALFIAGAPDPNWPPKVDAGPDRTITGTRRVLLRAPASDVDQDMLSWSWSSNAGITIDSVPNPCVTVPADGTFTFTATVDDGNGHRASDSTVYTFGSGGTTPPDPPSPIGEGWGHSDVGAVGAPGGATFDGFIRNGHGLTVSGSGADIWGTADEFHYAWKSMTGDFEIETRVASVDPVHPWTKAGLMIRASAQDAASPHASIFVTPGNGVVFQRRLSRGASSVSLQGPALTAPVFLRLVRQRGTTSAWYRKREVDRWTLLGEQSGLTSPTVDVGVAVTSHSDGAIARAKFEGVYLATVPAWGVSAIGGASGGAGDTHATVYTVQGSGTDIWGTSDSFEYMWVRMSGRATVTARVLGVENTYPWAKAGVMIRESLAPDSKHADVVVTPGKGIAMQYRSTTGGTSVMAAQAAGAAPVWVRLWRFEAGSPGAVGGVQADYSTDGVFWRVLGSVNFDMTHDVYVGIAVTSHNPSVEMRATLDHVRVEP